ncbi:MAG: hypothetical protein NTY96_01190 [Bacteroidetes bacterium]|nr:hypothetical protein [Bacteroidota bacterium]
MKKFFLPFLFVFFTSTFLYSQDQPPQGQTQPTVTQPKTFTSHIKSGFYMKFGGSFPMVDFANQHMNYYPYKGTIDTIKFNQAKFGFVFELGYLIYIGPSFANHHLRAGIDATFLTASFNPTDQALPPNSKSSKKYEYWYYFGGQKFGPVLTINPVDYLMIDLSYKVNATAAWYNSMWGSNYTLNEVSLGIRYRIMLFAFQYNWGKVRFTYNQDDNPKYWLDTSTFRILVGIKI